MVRRPILRQIVAEFLPGEPALFHPADENLGPGPGLSLVLFLFLPFLAVVQLGMSFSVVGMMSLGYALYQAWNQTNG